MRIALLFTLAAALALPTASSAKRDNLTDEARLAKALDGLTPGKPQSCINLREAQQTEAYGDSVLFTVGRKLVYKTESKGCGNRGSDTFVTRTIGTQLCRGDVIERVDLLSGMRSGFCIAGDFTPYKAVKQQP